MATLFVNGLRVFDLGMGPVGTGLDLGLQSSAEHTASVLGNNPVPINPYFVGFGDLIIMATDYICTT